MPAAALDRYCLDDPHGEVGECGFPAPQYGLPTGEYGIPKVPVTIWKVAAGFITFGLVLQVLCFIYSLFACFGCYSQKIQRWSTKMASASLQCVPVPYLC